MRKTSKAVRLLNSTVGKITAGDLGSSSAWRCFPLRRCPGGSVVSGDRGYQGAPRTMPRSVRQLEEVVFGVEQAQPARAMIVEARKSDRIVVEAGWIEIRNLCLELLREFSDVVQAEEEGCQAGGFLAVQADQTRQMITEPAMLREQGLPDRGHVETVKGQRAPPWPVVRMQGRALPQKR